MKKRDVAEIQSEFTRVCAELGDLVFKHSQVEDAISDAKTRQKQLSKEYNKAVEYSKNEKQRDSSAGDSSVPATEEAK